METRWSAKTTRRFRSVDSPNPHCVKSCNADLSKGKYDQEWMMVARDNMLQKIKENREDDQYNLLSLCKSPLLTIPEDLAKNIRSISALDMLLTALLPDWRNFLGTDDSELETGPSQAYGLSSDIFEETKISEAAQQSIEYAGDDPSALMSLRSKWALDQKELKMKFMDEAALIGQENDQAARRKHDYTSIIYNSIKILAEHGVLKEIAHDIIGAE
jgi:ubiquitin carboxyl-terminal hydrolase L5